MRVRGDILVRLGRVPARALPERMLEAFCPHAPEFVGISQGKARVRYEFGTKVIIATTPPGVVVGKRTLQGNPCDGHTPAEALERVRTLTERRYCLAVVDRGYSGHGVETTRVLITATARADAGKTAHTPQRHRARDRPHEDRCPPRVLPAQGRCQRRHLVAFVPACHNIHKFLAQVRALLVQLIACPLKSANEPHSRAVAA